MFLHWIPWKFFIGRIARSYGFIDPLTFLAKLRRFSQPSEVQEPIELVRAGIQFHARGLINIKAIQHNLDWVWPYWVEKQFNPRDMSFIPRGFAVSHINITQRNWTSVGLPDAALYPIVDPRGLVTPLYNGWSVDFWVYTADGDCLLPSRAPDADQCLDFEFGLSVNTRCRRAGAAVSTAAAVTIRDGTPVLNVSAKAESPLGGWLVAALRPYNPEGVQFIEKIEYNQDSPGWMVNDQARIDMSQTPAKVLFSNYAEGDVFHKLGETENSRLMTCPVGMASSAALFPIDGNRKKRTCISVPLYDEEHPARHPPASVSSSWTDATAGAARLTLPDKRFAFLYEASVRTLVLLSPGDVFPGPYTYRRFWFRDAAFMAHALCVLGLTARVRPLLNVFVERQKKSGYFHSQEGEWDSNGQVLWLFDRFQKLTGDRYDAKIVQSIRRAAHWIQKKRCRNTGGRPHEGLLPAGFSAEHLGPNDYYYWDDFWAAAGLKSAARLTGDFVSEDVRQEIRKEADNLLNAVFQSIAAIPVRRSRGAIPASPYRRMDAGAVGSLVADFPLQITAPGDSRIMNTMAFLVKNCFYDDAFFQDMTHSGLNAYLTLMIAQSFLRNHDVYYEKMIQKVADMASDTGQWPEAVHPFSGGGCMGDGQHGWAAAEWAMMVRNLFVREEGDTIILGSGIFRKWLDTGCKLFFGPTKTPFGSISVAFNSTSESLNVDITADFGDVWPEMEICVPGYLPASVTKGRTSYSLKKKQ